MVYLICLGTIVFFLILYAALHKVLKKHMSLVLKIFGVLIIAVFFVRYYASSSSLFDGVVGLSDGNPFAGEASPFSSDAFCAIVIVAVWFEIASVIVCAVFPFFGKQRVFRNYAKTFTLAFSVINILLLRWTAYSYTGNYDLNVCSVCMAVEAGLVFCMGLHTLYYNGGFRLSRKEFAEMMYVLPVVLLFTMMPYMLQALLGNFGYMRTESFKLFHRGYMYCTFVFLIVLFFYLRGKDIEYVRMVLLYMALAAMITYCYKYDYTSIYTVTKWPLHLCNTAMFIIPICLIFRFDWLFYFSLFIGVVGAMFAVFRPNIGIYNGVFSTSVVAYWQNHIIAVSMPVVMVLLGVYKRPRLRHFLYSLIGFAVYFAIVLFVNAYYGTDFFFTNGDEITSVLGTFGDNVMEFAPIVTVGERELTFYPVYQSLFFVIYIAFALIMWFVYEYVFHLQDMYRREEARHRRMKLDEYALRRKYGQKKVAECRNERTVDEISVNGLCKRYDGADVYAVSDVSFEVRSGEILGFLGPNGAGKSTVIKCMVGIHPMTEGAIEINGYDVSTQEVEVKSQIGFVPDHYALHEKLTGREYINYVADIYGVSERDRDERLGSLLKKLGMSGAIDGKIQTYSHGMKQKLAIMAALIYEPKVLVMDEPLTGLDPNSVYQAKECIREHAEKGNIVFLSSHLVDVVEKLCTRVIVIGNGTLLSSVDIVALHASGKSLESYYLETTEAVRGVKRRKAEKADTKEDDLDFLFRRKTKGQKAV